MFSLGVIVEISSLNGIDTALVSVMSTKFLHHCPNTRSLNEPKLQCQNKSSQSSKDIDQSYIIKIGYFYRSSDRKYLQRFLCKRCRSSFSTASISPCLNQKRRDINDTLKLGYVSGLSQNRLARLLFVNPKTIAFKLKFLAHQARQENQKYFESRLESKAHFIHFDEIESSIHTKLKPVSIPMIVEEKSRKILGFDVVSMPAKGKLYQLSVQKYGPRADDRTSSWLDLFSRSKPILKDQNLTIYTDEKAAYKNAIRKSFSNFTHLRTPGGRGCVVGQGELKNKHFDPMFSFNHTAAMLRANINRLFRRTWNTSKNIERLKDHIDLYVHYHNSVLTCADTA